MNASEARDFIERFREDRKRNDPQITLSQFTDDAEFSIAGQPSDRSIAVSTRGAGVADIATALVTNWHWLDVNFKDILVDGDLIVVRYLLTVRHVPSDRTFTTEVVDFVRVRDGKIASMREFIDTAMVGALATGI